MDMSIHPINQPQLFIKRPRSSDSFSGRWYVAVAYLLQGYWLQQVENTRTYLEIIVVIILQLQQG